MIDPVRSRRGRSNRRRGNDFERTLATELGGRRVGQYGEPADVLTSLLAVQAKVGASFSERYWRWLSAIPRTGVCAPRSSSWVMRRDHGHRRRAFVVIELGDFRDLHGEDGP